MSKKTAMQELIAEFTSIKETKCTNMLEVMFFDGVLAIIEGKYIEKEKQQIIDAFHEGGCSVTSCTVGDPETGEEYYSQTYKS